MKTKKILLFALCVFSGLSLTAQVRLSFNPEKGARYQYKTEMIQNIRQTAMGQEIPMEQEMSFVYEMNVKQNNRQEIQLEFVYRDVFYLLSSTMMKMAYDSKNPLENPSQMDEMMGKMLGSLIDKPFEVKMKPDGSVTSVTGMDVMAEDMIKAVATDGQIAAQMSANMKQQFSNEAMRNTFEQSFKIYPDKEIKVGERWEKSQSMQVSGMSTDIKTGYTLKSVNKNTALVDLESVLTLKPAMGMEGEISGTQSGTMEIDVKTGLPVVSDITQIIKGNLTTQGVSVLMDIQSKVKTSTTKIK